MPASSAANSQRDAMACTSARIAIHDPPSMRAQVNATMHARVAGDDADPAVAVCVVVDALPVPAVVVGSEQPALATDLAGHEQRRRIVAILRFSESQRVGIF